ncbi:hypothetical protein CTAYLR_009524 [Chrysophaeum taylorii]|uniref:DnaJ homologue subfamily C member 28 conserved domain-containing protein n=1 Tax=Chrysophaeum taylorii TaxID=2483200 RepID=A0AAD7XMS2_9STRA|nr:hypothetical protein CTAYLR_009524 [Chrysophaeum taylorii]
MALRRLLHASRRAHKSRLGRLAEDAALITGSSQAGSADASVDPTFLVAERKILDAMRRGAFDQLDGAGKPRVDDAHKAAIDGMRAGAASSYLMAKQLAAANVKPQSLELREEVRAARDRLVASIQNTALERRLEAPHLREAAADLQALIKRQHLAAIADARSFGVAGDGLQVRAFDFEAEVARLGRRSADGEPISAD